MAEIQPTRYQLFSTNQFTTRYPEHFVYSHNEKKVSVLAAYAFYEMIDNHGNKSYIKPEYWQLHSSFVQEEDSKNQYVCMFYEPLYHKRKYRQVNNAQGFHIWITDYNGKIIEPNENLHIVIELLLQY